MNILCLKYIPLAPRGNLRTLEQVGYKLYWTPRHVAKNSSHIKEAYTGSVHSNVSHSDELSTYTVMLRHENTLFAQCNTLTSKQQVRQVDARAGRLYDCGLRANITKTKHFH